MKNYRKLLLEANQAGNVAGILPTDVCQVLTEYFYKQNDIDKIQDILEGSLIELSQSSAVDLYISVLFFDTIFFMQEKNIASFTIHTSTVAQAIAKGIKNFQEELNNSITFSNGLVKLKPMSQFEKFNQKHQKNERFSIMEK